MGSLLSDLDSKLKALVVANGDDLCSAHELQSCITDDTLLLGIDGGSNQIYQWIRESKIKHVPYLWIGDSDSSHQESRSSASGSGVRWLELLRRCLRYGSTMICTTGTWSWGTIVRWHS